MVTVLRSCQSPIWTRLVNCLHLHLHLQPPWYGRSCGSCNRRIAAKPLRSGSSYVLGVSTLAGSLLVHAQNKAHKELCWRYTDGVKFVQKRVTFVWLIASSQQTAVLSLAALRSSTTVAGARSVILRSLTASAVRLASMRVQLMWRAAS